MPPLSLMIKPVSSACNLRCRYCFYADVASLREHASYGVMSRDTLQELVRKAFIYADGAVSFTFQGGEPTLAGAEFYAEFLSLTRRYNTRGLRVSYSLQTNACALTDELCALFAANHFLLGVSLDGPERIHDSLRVDATGAGSHARVLDGIAMLRKHHVDFNILCVVTSELARNAEEAWRALAPYGYVQFIPCIDDFSGEKRAYSLNAADYGRFLTDTFALYESAYRAGNPVSVRQFDNWLEVLLGNPSEMCGVSGKCGLYYLIEADGSAYPCDFYVLDEWRLGNVNSASFARLSKSDAATRFIDMSLNKPPECANCTWQHICHGGCRRDREPFANAIPSSNRFCKSYSAFFETCYDRMCALAESIRRR